VNFSDRLRQLVDAEMAAEEASQAVVAARMDLSAASLTNYLNGRTPKSEELMRIATHYKVSIDWLLTGKGSNYGGPNEESLVVRDELADNIRRLPDSQRKPLEQLVGSLIAQNSAHQRASSKKTEEKADDAAACIAEEEHRKPDRRRRRS
jgi:transcriptional regulator with XRE-family HTH domain